MMENVVHIKNAVLAAPVQHHRAGPVGHVPLGHTGCLELQVRALLPQSQQLPQVLVLIGGVLGLPQLVLQLRHPAVQLRVLLLKLLHAFESVANAGEPVRHRCSGGAKRRRDHAQRIVEKPCA